MLTGNGCHFPCSEAGPSLSHLCFLRKISWAMAAFALLESWIGARGSGSGTFYGLGCGGWNGPVKLATGPGYFKSTSAYFILGCAFLCMFCSWTDSQFFTDLVSPTGLQTVLWLVCPVSDPKAMKPIICLKPPTPQGGFPSLRYPLLFCIPCWGAGPNLIIFYFPTWVLVTFSLQSWLL